MKKIWVFMLSSFWLSVPAAAWASGGHAKGSGALAHSLESTDLNMIFLAMVGNVIVLSMIAAEIIRHKRGQSVHEQQQ